MLRRLLVAIMALTFIAGVTACKDEGPLEKAGKGLDEAKKEMEEAKEDLTE
jgi:predicted small lipoprotein YifL